MMDCTYYLTQNLLERNAANLVFSLKEINSSVFLYRENGRRVNGKSLVGILSARFMQGETIKILIDNPDEMGRIRSILNEIGTEVP
ncbi:MAG: HPr family phosphocarrier protein [Clostridia bacterium]|nr:HPr family phosphocarrier protein [Clostridia bacterium]